MSGCSRTKGLVGGADGVKFDERALLKAHNKADAWRLLRVLRAERGKVRHRRTEGQPRQPTRKNATIPTTYLIFKLILLTSWNDIGTSRYELPFIIVH